MAGGVRQASIMFDNVVGFTKHPSIKKRLHVRDHIKQIIDREGGGKIQIFSSSPEQLDGFSSSFLAVDEICSHADIHSRRIWSKVVNSDAARSEPMKVVISTPQDNLSSLGAEIYQQAKRIINSEEENLSILGVIYGGRNGEPSSPENWALSHPAYGEIVTEEYYQKAWEKAKSSPHAVASFRTLLLADWVGNIASFINPVEWAACGEDLVEQDFHGENAYYSCDFGGKYSLLAWTVNVWRDDKLYVFPRFAIPAGTLSSRIKTEHSEYLAWCESGLIKTCPGAVIDREVFKSWIEDDLRNFNISYASIDPYNMEDIRQWLENEKGVKVMEVNTTNYPTMGPLTLQFEKMVKDRSIVHPNNPVLNWNVECMSVKPDQSGRIKPDKKGSGGTSKQNDGAISLIVGLQALPELQNAGDWVASIYKR